MALNNSPAQQAPCDDPHDAPTEAPSSRTSLFGGTSPPGTPRTPRLAESPSPSPSPPNTPSPLDRRLSGDLKHSPSRTPLDDAQSDETSGEFPYLARGPSLPYEAWETVSTTLGQINGA